MAQTIIGLDIGSFSVKVATVKAGLRSVTWESFEEFEIPHSGRARPEKAAAQAVEAMGRDLTAPGSVVVSALPGDRVMTRFIKLPFDDPKRIDSVLGFELEGQVPLGVEEMSYSYQVVGKDDEGRTQIFAAAVKHEYMERYLESLNEAGLDPRVLTLDTTSYVHLYEHLGLEGTVAFVDIGHQTTKVCVVADGELRLARSIGRGGHAVTKAIAAHFELEFDEAEQIKHDRGELPSADAAPGDLAAVCGKSMRSLVTAIKQTCQAYARESGDTVQSIQLTGGGSRLHGCIDWLESSMGLPIVPMSLESLPICKVKAWPKMGASSAAKSLGLCLYMQASNRHAATLNFRRGEYAFEGDFKYLREKLTYLAGMAAALLIVAAAYGMVRNNSLQKQLDAQQLALGNFTEQYLDKRETSFQAVEKRLKRPPSKKDEILYFPPMTAVAVLDKITSVQDDINNTASHAVIPGGPTRRQGLPGVTGARDERGNPRLNPKVDARGGRPDNLRPAIRPGMAPSPVVRPGMRPGVRPGARPGSQPDDPSGPGPDAPDDAVADEDDGGISEDEARAAQAEFTQIELHSVVIDVYGDVTVKAQTHQDNHKGRTALRDQLAAEPCFTQVKQKDENSVLFSDRHKDWKPFEVKFKVECPTEKGETPAGGKK